jgi:hypothetical protein
VAASLALEVNEEGGRGAAVAKVLVVAMSRSVKSCSCIRGLWLEVAGRNGDAQSVGERSNAMLRLSLDSFLLQGSARKEENFTQIKCLLE